MFFGRKNMFDFAPMLLIAARRPYLEGRLLPGRPLKEMLGTPCYVAPEDGGHGWNRVNREVSS